MSDTLIIFVRNPVLGKVKTRIAATLGNEKALQVYIALMQKTYEVVRPLTCNKFVYYSDMVADHDLWSGSDFYKRVQTPGDLGEKMEASFKEIFAENDGPVVIIGSDCYDLETKTIENAFAALKYNDVVIGPAEDGGYYLLGLKKMNEEVFRIQSWSTDKVYKKTFASIKKENLQLALLPVLNDIDEAEDINFPY